MPNDFSQRRAILIITNATKTLLQIAPALATFPALSYRFDSASSRRVVSMLSWRITPPGMQPACHAQRRSSRYGDATKRPFVQSNCCVSIEQGWTANSYSTRNFNRTLNKSESQSCGQALLVHCENVIRWYAHWGWFVKTVYSKLLQLLHQWAFRED